MNPKIIGLWAFECPFKCHSLSVLIASSGTEAKANSSAFLHGFYSSISALIITHKEAMSKCQKKKKIASNRDTAQIIPNVEQCQQ